jgi:SSS family solute:Na+ symporter
MLSIGTLWGKTVLGGGNGSDPRHPRPDVTHDHDLRTKRLSQAVCVLAGLVALGGSLFYPNTLVQLSVLSYEGLAQLVPVVLLSLFWRRMTARAGISGMLTGLAVMTALWATDNDPWHGVNGGIIALAANLVVTFTVTRLSPGTPTAPRIPAQGRTAMAPKGL